jgi:hypothetical protein
MIFIFFVYKTKKKKQIILCLVLVYKTWWLSLYLVSGEYKKKIYFILGNYILYFYLSLKINNATINYSCPVLVGGSIINTN